MKQTPIRAVEMVRTIRDEIYEETKRLSPQELREFYDGEAAAMRQEQKGPTPHTPRPARSTSTK
jgi:hypothetical protein